MIEKSLISKKLISLIIISIMFLTFTLPALATENIEDISTDHWAYESVKKLVDQGLISLQDDNYFAGEEKVNRYELAEVIAKLLLKIEQGGVQASQEDAELLRELSTEFRAELVELNLENDFFAQEIERLQEEKEVLREDLLNTKEEILEARSVQAEIKEIIKDITEEQEKSKEELELRLVELESQNQELSRRLNNLEGNIDNQAQERSDFDQDLKNLRFGGLALLILLIASY